MKKFSLSDYKKELTDEDVGCLKEKYSAYSHLIDKDSSQLIYELCKKDQVLLDDLDSKSIKSIVNKILDYRNDLSHGRGANNINDLCEVLTNAKVILRLAIIDVIDDENSINKTEMWLNSRKELSRYYKS